MLNYLETKSSTNTGGLPNHAVILHKKKAPLTQHFSSILTKFIQTRDYTAAHEELTLLLNALL
ncbi:MAG: hypothetical protein H6765_01820 [Candidatus Peribacteria bacterium]|nr:MAG: hypothetical protein H6765_01820 [Candidatus Peribacteria bacterium]